MMDIKQLKEKIESNTLNDSPLILKYDKTGKFIINQYIKAICKNKGLEKLHLDDLSVFSNNDDLFDSLQSYLYIYDVDKLSFDILPEYKNLIVVCNKIEVNTSIDYIEIPEIVSWQIDDYLKLRLPGLSDEERKWLCDITKYNIYRIENEAKKLEIFPEASQKIIFRQLNSDNAYADLNILNIFNFTNAIIKKDLNTINDILSNIRYIDIEGTGVVTILLKNFKNIIDIQFNPNATAASLGLNPKQFAGIKYNVNKFTNNQLLNIYEFLTGIDYELKSGNLSFSNNVYENNAKIVEYVTLKVLSLGSN